MQVKLIKTRQTWEKSSRIAAEHSTRPSSLVFHITTPLQDSKYHIDLSTKNIIGDD